MNVLSAVRLKADENGVELYATDVRTSIICSVAGVSGLGFFVGGGYTSGGAVEAVAGVGIVWRMF